MPVQDTLSRPRYLFIVQRLIAIAIFTAPSLAAQCFDRPHIVPRTKAERLESGPTATLSPRPFRVDVNLVLVPVTVSNGANQPVTRLSQQNFELYEGTEKQAIQYFSREDSPISVGLILDFSGSMKNKVEYEREAVTEFFNNAHPEDEYFVVTVSTHPKLVASSEQSIGTIMDQLTQTVPQGETALFDAIYLGISKLRSSKYQRKALVIVSDGGDNHSRYTLREIRSLVEESDVLTYAVGIFDTLPVPLLKSFEERMGRKWLTDITEMSGGRTIAADDRREIPEISGTISRELRNQYVLGYHPSNAAHDGKWRKIKVRVIAPEEKLAMQLHYREGYFAPGQ